MPTNSDLPSEPATKHQQREPLAVIGIGCRFPGGIDSPAAFWNALLDGFNAIGDVPDDRWKHDRFHDTNPEKTGCIRNAKGGFIDGVDQFDGEFFGYFPAEAQRIDPQQRLLLEVTHEAMEDAGLRRDQISGTRTSVFVGSFMYDFLCMQAAGEHRDEINPYVAMGTAVSPLANRISYDFDLKGPSVSLDTACSSSLVALHQACRSLWGDEADMAIAGGVNVMLRPESSIMLSKAGFLNPDQYCKAFDASANGYVRGEGVGVVLLKPLSRARADGDAVYAVIRNTAVNQDGYLPEGFTVPNVFSQIALLESVYEEAGIDPLTVDFVEAHGTGTPVGDPIETLALGAVLGRDRDEDQGGLLIGSVKTNLGHMEGAAGIAGFIKGVLAAHHGVVPRNLHFHEPNPEIDWDNLNLCVPTSTTPLPAAARTHTVGVNSFGAGGTNAHVVLQQFAADTSGSSTDADGPAPSAFVYMLSSVHREALRTLAWRHAEFLAATDVPLADAAYSAMTRRSRYPNMVAVVGRTKNELVDRLRAFSEGHADPAVVTAQVAHKRKPRVAFVFSGQGGQWTGMGRDLLDQEPVFREALARIDRLLTPHTGWSLLDELQRPDGESRIHDTLVVQPAVMAIQVALVELYAHYGVRPDGIVGHSIGEVAAAHAAGALTLEQAVDVISQRSQAQDNASGRGGMLAVGLTLEDAHAVVEAHEGRVSIAAVNGPEMLTLSGDTEPLAAIAELLESRGVFCRTVRVQVAYHSHHMEGIRNDMLDRLETAAGEMAMIPLYSTVSGRREDGTHLDADYWYHNVRQPVLFTSALNAMLEDGYDTFIEIGPHPVLTGGAAALVRKLETNAVILAASKRGAERECFLQSLAQLTARGSVPDLVSLFGPNRRFVRLPTHPWQHSRYWFESPAAAEMRRGRFEHPFLKRRTQLVTEDGPAVWEAALNVQKFPYLRDHQVDGEIVLPATGHVDLAWAVAAEQFRQDSTFLENLHFDLPLVLPESNRHPLEVRLEIVSEEGDYHICSRSADGAGDAAWSKHSSGRINTAHDRFSAPDVSLEDLRRQFGPDDALPVDTFYETIHDAGLDYGKTFQCIEELWHRGHEMLSRVRLPDDLHSEAGRYAIHPSLLDACLHTVFADVHSHGFPERVFLPYRIDRVRFRRRPGAVVYAWVRVDQNDERFLRSDTLIFEETGELVGEVIGLTCKRLAGAGARLPDADYDGCYEYRWLPEVADSETHHPIFDYTTVLLIGEDGGLAAATADRLAADGLSTRLISSAESFDVLPADIALDRRTLIVFFGSLSPNAKVEWPGLAECPSVPSFLELARSLAERDVVPGLCVVTAGATGRNEDAPLDLQQALLHGMARVVNNECPSVPLRIIDVSARPSSVDLTALHHELLHRPIDRDETEVALRGEERWVRRLVPVEREDAEQAAASSEAGVAGSYHAEVSDPGMLDQIVFRRLPSGTPAENEVEIAVEAAALNFKDVMNGMGLLPPHAVSGGLAGERLGLEVSGEVLRCGECVQHVSVGQKVVARVADGFAGRVIVPAHCVARRPKWLTPQQAAAVPVVFITAWYSLCHLARMQRGETLLIHSAAGGVGGAAIQLARHVGVRVIATAGTKDKRAGLRALGIEHVFDSRSLDFSNQVLEATDGRGVDIVLNSLTGRFITQSLKCLAPFGRFIELGKADIYRNSKLGLERLGENVSYFVVDVDRLALQRPELHQEILTTIVELFEQRELEPHEITEFPVSQLPAAMKFMTRAAYRGKIVLNMQDDTVSALPPRRVAFRSDATYLITGGASGFGLQIARWMCERGARHLVLVSRSGPRDESDHQTIAEMRGQGTIVHLAQADVASLNAIEFLLQELAAELPPLAGVIHGAAVLDDASLRTIDMPRFERVFRPKAEGAWNLHSATRAAGIELDFFVMLSSISSVLGLVGQVNYATANFFQDALARHRQQLGLAASSVNLGVLGEYAGMSRAANDSQGIVSLLESHGMAPMPLADVLARLEAVLVQQPVQRMTARMDWSRFRNAYPHLARDVRFLDLMSDAALARRSRGRRSTLRAALEELSPEDRHVRVSEELTTRLAGILDAQADKLDINASIDTLGLDSLALTDFQIWIMRLLDINLPLIKLLKGPSISSLTTELLSQLDTEDEAESSQAATAVPGESDATLADLEGISVVTPWLLRGSGDADAAYRLICFHSMGVGASLFTNFLLNPPSGCDLLAVQTPGRENRAAEPVVESLAELVDEVTAQVRPLFDRPVVMWGHSFGGIVAGEVILRLREQGIDPAHYIVSGTLPPHLVHLLQKRDTLLKAMVADNSPEYLISLSRYVDDPEFIKSILPLMRRDYPLLREYRYRPGEPLNCGITALAARRDDMVYTDEIREWGQHTQGGFDLIEVDGDHWFLNRNRELITDVLERIADRAVTGSGDTIVTP